MIELHDVLDMICYLTVTFVLQYFLFEKHNKKKGTQRQVKALHLVSVIKRMHPIRKARLVNESTIRQRCMQHVHNWISWCKRVITMLRAGGQVDEGGGCFSYVKTFMLTV